MALRLKSISKINAKSAINENITIDAKHNDMVKHFKDLQKSIPILKNDLKNLINKYKTLDTKDKSEFEVIMEKNDLRDKINELKEKINCIVEKEEENKYFLEVGVLLHNYYETMENSKNDDAENDFEKNLLNTEEYDEELTSDDDELEIDNESVVSEISEKKPVYKSVLNFFNERETKNFEDDKDKVKEYKEPEKDNGYTSMKISDFVKEETVIKKKNILDEYLKKIDPNYITKIKIDNNICKCPSCKTEMTIYPSDGIQICENCGLQENILIESDKPSFKDPPMEVSYFSYKRINHYNESTGINDKMAFNESYKYINKLFDLIINLLF
jgi:hypothetical protein